MHPLRDIVLVKVDRAQTMKSGFYIKEDWKTLPPVGTVKAIGTDVTTVKPGDRVVFERYASVQLENDQRLCKESHVLAVIHE